MSRFHFGRSVGIVMALAMAVCLTLVAPAVSHSERTGLAEALTQPISFGDCLPASISVPGEVDTYTFSGNANDAILIGISKTSGGLWPKISVFGEGLTVPTEDFGTTHAEIELRLPSTATYTILVSDSYNGALVGDYDLFIQRVSNPGQASTISFGQLLTGTVAIPADMASFSFTASPGDVILLGASRASGNMWPEIRLYAPGGLLLATNSGTTHAEQTQTLPVPHMVYVPTAYRNASGAVSTTSAVESAEQVTGSWTSTYVVLIGDSYGTLTGDFGLYLQRLSQPANVSAATFGQVVTSTIGYPGSTAGFTFQANAADTILLGASRASGGVWPRMQVYGPLGALIAQNIADSHAEITTTLELTGTHLVLLSDGYSGTLIGDLNLHLQRLNNLGNAVQLNAGQLVSATISIPADTDTFVFDGNAGDTMEIRIARVSGNLWPRVSLYGPGGVLLGSASDPVSAVFTRTLSTGGTYGILASDGFNGTLVGGYNLGLDFIPLP